METLQGSSPSSLSSTAQHVPWYAHSGSDEQLNTTKQPMKRSAHVRRLTQVAVWLRLEAYLVMFHSGAILFKT